MSDVTRVVAAGVGLRGDGYPNAINTLRLLARDAKFDVEDRVKWLPEGAHLWRIASGSVSDRARLVLTLVLGNLRSLAGVIRRGAGRDVLIYVPYPAIFFLWWASWLPLGFRPRMVADAYISIWDTVFRDRAQMEGNSFAGRVVGAIERRALRAATVVLTDTEANRDWMSLHFGLPSERVVSLPLALGVASPAHTDGVQLELPCNTAAPLHVLFVGTMIPLHGVAVVAKCLERLKCDPRFRFTLVGDGQDASLIERTLSGGTNTNVEWHRGWLEAKTVRAYVRRADVCLGVFGGAGKAARVLPFKIYLALAEGRAVLTQRSMSLPQGVPDLPCTAIDPVPDALVAALERMADNRQLLIELGERALEFHRRWLGDDAIVDAWHTTVTEKIRSRD